MGKEINFDNIKNSVQEFLNKGYRYKEIAYILGFKNEKQLSNYNNRKWKISRIKSKLYCINCGKELIGEQITFCSHKCSASINNKKRKKYKITKKLLSCLKCGEENLVDARASKYLCKKCKNEPKIKGEKKLERVCKKCGKRINKKFKLYCEDCRFEYYKLYRPSCEFHFDPLSYCGWFDCDKIKKFGKYSPKNKGNNLNGISRDHMFSVKDGYNNGVSPELIKHPANCKLMIHNNNSSKGSKSSITLEELVERISLFEEYMSSFPTARLQNECH